MDARLPLDIRKQQILKAVVSDYTETGVPVGSHALATHLAAWSSATIRNELSTLVEIGYLLQPHTSAGRVPSDLGYRYYVDFLMEEEAIPVAVRRQLEPYFRDMPADLEQLLELAASTLALVTDAVSIVTGPRMLIARAKHLDLISLSARQALVLIVLEGNIIKQQPVTLSADADQIQLSGLATLFNETFRGLSADEIHSLPVPSGVQHPLRQELTTHIIEFMRGVDARQDAVVVHDGVRNLLHQPEFVDVERLQQVLEVVDEERILGEMLTSMEVGQGVSIVIGRESGVAQLAQCSLVLTTYRAGIGRAGTIGVLGPTRMRYSQVAPRVRYVAQRIGEAVERILG